MIIGFIETLNRRLKSIFNQDYRLVDIENQVYNGKHYDYRSQQFFIQVRELQVRKGYSQSYAAKIIKSIYQVKEVVKKERDEVSQKDIEKVEMILETYANDDLDSGIEVVHQFGTPD